eukprot:TRINITY_DN8811_c0_g3_i4.p1 TRINITY_DN8811_c0_g3~~TRINITY_DN8811_c0_g3_i4.p1  ORF type:complete len:120 (-),score=20.72 TRINITY_DN8811_c0_g3_i4:116-475(-)
MDRLPKIVKIKKNVDDSEDVQKISKSVKKACKFASPYLEEIFKKAEKNEKVAEQLLVKLGVKKRQANGVKLKPLSKDELDSFLKAQKQKVGLSVAGEEQSPRLVFVNKSSERTFVKNLL